MFGSCYCFGRVAVALSVVRAMVSAFARGAKSRCGSPRPSVNPLVDAVSLVVDQVVELLVVGRDQAGVQPVELLLCHCQVRHIRGSTTIASGMLLVGSATMVSRWLPKSSATIALDLTDLYAV